MLMVLTAVTFLVMISVLVAAHEYGHFLFARLFGMEVEEFAIGFGKRKWVYRRKNGTEFTFRPWPLGGFVRIKGMAPMDDGSEVDVPGGFYSKPPLHRIVVLFAGPLFSVIAGVILLVGLFLSVPRHTVNEAVLGEVLDGKPAAVAGLRAGDRIRSVDGRPVASWFDLVASVRDRPDQTIVLTYERDGRVGQVRVKPSLSEEPTPVIDEELKFTGQKRRQAMIGAAAMTRRSTMGEAVGEALRFPVEMTVGFVGALSSADRFKADVGGPISILGATNQSVKGGPADVILLAGLLSISLGIFNLLPIPGLLDGGQIFLATLELLRGGRRLSIQTQSILSGVGLTILFVLVVSVFAVDIGRLGRGSGEPAANSAEK